MEDIIKNLKEGVVIKGPFWPEEVKIYVVKEIGKRIQIIGAGLKSEKSYSTLHSLDEFREKVEDESFILPNFKGKKIGRAHV